MKNAGFKMPYLIVMGLIIFLMAFMTILAYNCGFYLAMIAPAISAIVGSVFFMAVWRG